MRDTQVSRLLEERQKQLLKHSPAFRKRFEQQTDSVQRRRLAAAAVGLSSGGTGTTISPIFDTCIDNFVSAYLNMPAVQAAIHVTPATTTGGKWKQCGLTGMYDFNYESELPNYMKWTAENKLNILIYNGDADYILSHMGNTNWITHVK
jgi:hypothetical protein